MALSLGLVAHLVLPQILQVPLVRLLLHLQVMPEFLTQVTPLPQEVRVQLLLLLLQVLLDFDLEDVEGFGDLELFVGLALEVVQDAGYFLLVLV